MQAAGGILSILSRSGHGRRWRYRWGVRNPAKKHHLQAAGTCARLRRSGLWLRRETMLACKHKKTSRRWNKTLKKYRPKQKKENPAQDNPLPSKHLLGLADMKRSSVTQPKQDMMVVPHLATDKERLTPQGPCIPDWTSRFLQTSDCKPWKAAAATTTTGVQKVQI